MKCLYCYNQLEDGMHDYHPRCARKIFDAPTVPDLPYTRADIKELAREIVSTSSTVTGVQAKLSLDISRVNASSKRFTIVGLWGQYILKPQTSHYNHLPELEDLTMHMAEAVGIKVVPHSLIRFSDGELCYITRRIDRLSNGQKIAMEDFCQLSERLTEYKYKGSYERISRLIKKYSTAPWLDIAKFWEVVLFSWITGNADMHLKNFSLYKPNGDYILSPAYDLLSTSLVMPEDPEELALTLNAKKRKITRGDFVSSMLASGIEVAAINKLFKKMQNALPKWIELIEKSFIPPEMKKEYIAKVSDMLSKLILD